MTEPGATPLRLTGRGWALVGSTAVLTSAGLLFGIQELLAVSAAVVVILGCCLIGVWRRSWDLHTIRRMHPPRVAAGGHAEVELTIANRSGRRSPVVAAREPFDRGRHVAAFAVAPLAPGQTVRASYRVPTAERGVFEVGPLAVELADPFGLVSTTRAGAPPSTLTVHPRVVALVALRRPPGADHRRTDASRAIRQAGGDFFAVREYRTGDDLRRVHWASTARLGDLMIRQEETPAQGRLCIAVDLRRAAWLACDLETALAAAASVAVATLSQGLGTRLITSAGVDTGFATSELHAAALLDVLAQAQATRPGRDTDLAGSLDVGTGDAVVAVTCTASVGRPFVAGFATPGRLLTAVVVGPRRPASPVPPPTAVPGALMVTVLGGLEGLPEAWARSQAQPRAGSRP